MTILIGVPNDRPPKNLYSGQTGGWSYKTFATAGVTYVRNVFGEIVRADADGTPDSQVGAVLLATLRG